MCDEIRALGFDTVELSFNLTKAMVRSVAASVRRGRIRVASVHNYAPVPDRIPRSLALPDCLSLSSDDENERAQAVRFTKRSIDTAHDLHAQCVILHCGRVAVVDRTRDLCRLYRQGKAESDEFLELRERALHERSALAAASLEEVLRSIDELAPYARRRNISLGIETRFYHREIPSFEELGSILRRFRGADVYYWHDTGHAQVMENLGFYRHKDFLDAYRYALIGVHLHDLRGCSDHLAPGKGEFDFSLLRPYLAKATHKVLEVHQPEAAEEIRSGVRCLMRVFDGVL